MDLLQSEFQLGQRQVSVLEPFIDCFFRFLACYEAPRLPPSSAVRAHRRDGGGRGGGGTDPDQIGGSSGSSSMGGIDVDGDWEDVEDEDDTEDEIPGGNCC